MALVNIDPASYANLKDKVVVILGGTIGIGAVTVTLLLSAGAKVVLGDINTPQTLPSSENFTFVTTDVTKYDDVVNIFDTAYNKYQRLDHAITNAGLIEIGKLYDTGDTDEAIRKPPPTSVLDVNLTGTVFASRVAVHYMRKSLKQNKGSQKDVSILLVASVAGFGNWPGLFQYSASKHGVMGLFHSSKDFLWNTEGIRVNVVLPNMTNTGMTTEVIKAYRAQKVPTNEPEDVAEVYVHTIANPGRGQALYITGNKTYEIEQSFDDAKAVFLGQAAYDELNRGQSALSMGDDWT